MRCLLLNILNNDNNSNDSNNKDNHVRLSSQNVWRNVEIYQLPEQFVFEYGVFAANLSGSKLNVSTS